MEAFQGPHHLVAYNATLASSLSTGASSGGSTSATTLLNRPSGRGVRVGDGTLSGRRTVLLGLNGQREMGNHVTNEGGKSRSITLNNALGDEELAILAILGDRLEERTDLVLR
jgi:hypothetical protein